MTQPPDGLVTTASIEAAARTIAGVAVRTPLLETRWLDDARIDGEVRIKAESLQRGGAFKFRGAYTTISRLSDAERARGVVAPSSGNHGQAVALAAKLFGIRATIVMPVTAPAVKVAGVRRWGANAAFEGTKSSERAARAETIAKETGAVMVPPYDHADVIAGQGTAALEIGIDWPEVDAVLVPVGGGGLLSGIAAWIKRWKPSCRVVGVEPEGSDVMAQSIRAGSLVQLQAPKTIADGLRSDRAGVLTLAHARALVDEMVTVPDDAIELATRRLIGDGRLVVEYSGSVAVAALMAGRWKPEGRKTVAVISGGNLDPSIAATLFGSMGEELERIAGKDRAG